MPFRDGIHPGTALIMTKNNHLCRWLLLVVFTTACAGPQTKTLRLADGIMQSKADPDLAEVHALSAGFTQESFSAAVLKKYPDAGIDHLYDALFRVSFFFPEHDKSIDFQEKVLEEKLRRGKRVGFDIERMHKAYIGARKFKNAEALRTRFPDVKFPYVPSEILDNTSGGTAWRVYDFDATAEKAMLKALPSGTGPKVIMTMFPGCSAAETALEEILADPELSPLFRKYGMLLTLRFDTKSMMLWRDHFNFPEAYIAYKASDFPILDFDSSPNFYFLEDGKIKHILPGWSNPKIPGYGKTEMLKNMAAISISTLSHTAQ